MSLEYRVRVERFGVPDQFHNKKTVGKALKMLKEWDEEQRGDGRFRLTLDGTAILTIESRTVTEWADITADADADEATAIVLLGKGDFDA